MFGIGRKKKSKTPDRPTADAKRAGEAKRIRDNNRMRKQTASTQDIGPIPEVVNPARRESTRLNLRLFLEIYFPAIFYFPWSRFHLRMIEKLERAILHGRLHAYAMPRAQGKSSLAKCAALFALLHGHHPYVVYVGATAGHAEARLEEIKAMLRTNDLLLEDFPEVCFPIRAIQGDGRRCRGQTVEGMKTDIVWGSARIVLPTTKESNCSSFILTAGGILGALRGPVHMLPDGRAVRPSLVIPDDPQTTTSAASASQCRKRLRILNGDILMMSAPGVSISGAMPFTVIAPNCMADQILDRKAHPMWQAERSKMLVSFPTNMKLWDEYFAIVGDSLERDGSIAEATEFYQQHREEMDAGAESSWPERFNPNEISAIQSAMNLFFRDQDVFFAECQNEPKPPKTDTVSLKAADIIIRTNGHARGTVPTECTKVTGFIDVHDALLYWGVCGFTPEEFGGCAIDYSTFPEQPGRYFQLRQASPTMAMKFPGLTKEAVLYKSLESLVPQLLGRQWPRADGASMAIERLFIDQGYLPNVIHNFIRASGRGAIVMPSKGVGITASAVPMSEYHRKLGETIGDNWIIPNIATPGEVRHIRIDVNYWKTFATGRLALPMATRGAFTLYGDKPHEHRLLGDHVMAEYGVPTSGRGRDLVEWKLRPNKPDNHIFDWLVGCFVAASTIGCGKAFAAPPPPPRRPSYRHAISLDGSGQDNMQYETENTTSTTL